MTGLNMNVPLSQVDETDAAEIQKSFDLNSFIHYALREENSSKKKLENIRYNCKILFGSLLLH